MSLRLKERGGGGGKVTALKPLPKTLNPHHPNGTGTPTTKSTLSRTRSTPISDFKDNLKQRSVSRNGRSSVPRQRPSLSIIGGGDAAPESSLAVKNKPVLVPGSVRWSTSTLPKGRFSSSSSSSSSWHSDPQKVVPMIPEVVVEKRRWSSGVRVPERCRQKKVHDIPHLTHQGIASSNAKALGECRTKSVSSSLHSRKDDVSSEFPVPRKDSVASGGKAPKVLASSDKFSKRPMNYAVSWQQNTKETVNRNVEHKEKSLVGKDVLEAPVDKIRGVPNYKLYVEDRSTYGVDASENCKEKLNTNSTDEKCATSISSDNPIVLQNHKETICQLPALKDIYEKSEFDPSCVVAKSNDGDLRNLNSKATSNGNVAHVISVYGSAKEQKTDQSGEPDTTKYSSQLHKKLALLEGKVQRIATDIKRTKEMLDSNNPVASQLILTDIQNKILGIEKAVSHVIDGTDAEVGKTGSLKGDNMQLEQAGGTRTEKTRSGEVNSKDMDKSFSNEEMEARFYPHHRLLRNRMPSGTTGGFKKSCEFSIPVYACDPLVEDRLSSSIEENPVALEFLASIDAEGAICSRVSGIQERGSKIIATAGLPSGTKTLLHWSNNNDFDLSSNEKLEFNEHANQRETIQAYEYDDSSTDKLFNIGNKVSTGGWFVSEGEAVLLAHGDGSCSYYDIANTELKAQYLSPPGAPPNLWGDCWLIRAPGVDGCSGRYVVAASAGNSSESGFCSWDFFKRDVQAFRLEEGKSGFSATSSSSFREALAPLCNVNVPRSSLRSKYIPGNREWWYRPCGYLIVSASTTQCILSAYDVRDGGLAMTWSTQNPIVSMENSCPLQWRSRGKMIMAETEAISLWDVNSLNPQPLLSVACGGKKIFALHVNNTDAEIGGGVRQRVSSSEVEGNDGVFCTQDSINVFDFRLPSGVGLKISKDSSCVHSVYSRGDSILLGSTKTRSAANGAGYPEVQQFSLRKGTQMAKYLSPHDIRPSSMTQVWGDSNLAMGVCSTGLFVFDPPRNKGMQPSLVTHEAEVQVRETIGSNDLYHPTFDYLGGRALLISRDRPAMWRSGNKRGTDTTWLVDAVNHKAVILDAKKDDGKENEKKREKICAGVIARTVAEGGGHVTKRVEIRAKVTVLACGLC